MALSSNMLANNTDLIIFSDAAQSLDTQVSVDEVRAYLKTIMGFLSVTIHYRTYNFGLSKSIIEGVTEVLKMHERVIVLEDDLVTSVYFLRFMNEALERYKDEDRVFGVTGYTYPIDTQGIKSTFFLKTEGCWSWATWDRAWKYFEKDTDKLINTFTKTMIKEFNFDNSMDFWSQVILNKQGQINTWAIYWYATIFLNRGLFLHSKNSFAQNIGHDGSGIHCGESCIFDTPLAHVYDVEFERNIQESKVAREAYVEFFNSLKTPFHIRVFNKIKRILKWGK